jgi:hypothetical protein
MNKLGIDRQTAQTKIIRLIMLKEKADHVTHKYDFPNSRWSTSVPGAVGTDTATAGFDIDVNVCGACSWERSSCEHSSKGCAAANTATPSGQRKSK